MAELPNTLETRRLQMFPTLEAGEIERLTRFGEPRHYATATALAKAGQVGPGLILLLSGQVTVNWRDQSGHMRPIVTYGPGLHMLRDDTSPVKDRIKRLKELAFPGKIQFSACNNTKQNMEKAEGHAISIVPEATIVPAGVVRLMELQEQGWSYVRP